MAREKSLGLRKKKIQRLEKRIHLLGLYEAHPELKKKISKSFSKFLFLDSSKGFHKNCSGLLHRHMGKFLSRILVQIFDGLISERIQEVGDFLEDSSEISVNKLFEQLQIAFHQHFLEEFDTQEFLVRILGGIDGDTIF